MIKIEKSKITKHISYLKKKVFFNDTKWPHFNILFQDIIYLSKKFGKNKKVLFLERGGLYGKISIWAPLFHKSIVVSIDCSPEGIKKKGSYNKKYVEHKDIIKWPINNFSDYKHLNLSKNSYDLIIIPNLLHHISDHKRLIYQCYQILKKKGKLYTFEPMLRELHQAPDDYLRFTPFGLSELMKKNNFKIKKVRTSGGPFSAIIYCWDQAIQYFPVKKRVKKLQWLKKEIKKLMNYEKKYKKNKIRSNSSFPVSFSILAQK